MRPAAWRVPGGHDGQQGEAPGDQEPDDPCLLGREQLVPQRCVNRSKSADFAPKRQLISLQSGTSFRRFRHLHPQVASLLVGK